MAYTPTYCTKVAQLALSDMSSGSWNEAVIKINRDHKFIMPRDSEAIQAVKSNNNSKSKAAKQLGVTRKWLANKFTGPGTVKIAELDKVWTLVDVLKMLAAGKTVSEVSSITNLHQGRLYEIMGKIGLTLQVDPRSVK